MRAGGKGEGGQTTVLFAVAFIAVLGMAGLALDGARLYAEHARVQAAADAAAIGAAHELRRGHRRLEQHLQPAAVHDAGLQGVTAGEAEIIIHHPPATGRHQGSGDHVEAVVRLEMRTTLMGMFGKSRQAVSARAVAGLVAGADQPCVIALAASGAGTLTVEGEQPLRLECAAAVASSNAGAWSSGEACVDAAAGLALAAPASGACIEGERRPVEGVLRDFVPALRMPACAGQGPGATETAEDGTRYYWPGCYEEPVRVGGGRVQLMPGVYLFQQGLRIGGGEVRGAEVALLFPGAEGVEIDSAAAVELTPPHAGELAGVLMYATAAGGSLERGPGSSLEGALLFPSQTLRWAPNAPGEVAGALVIADRIAVLEGPGGRAVAAPPTQRGPVSRVALVE